MKMVDFALQTWLLDVARGIHTQDINKPTKSMGFPFGFMVSKMVDFPLCSPNGEEHWGQMQPVTIDYLKSQKEGPEPQV